MNVGHDVTGTPDGFPSRLKHLLETMYGRQWEAAKRLDVQPALLSKYFAGRVRPSFGFLERLALEGVNVQYLIAGHGSMFDTDTAQGQYLADQARQHNAEQYGRAQHGPDIFDTHAPN